MIVLAEVKLIMALLALLAGLGSLLALRHAERVKGAQACEASVAVAVAKSHEEARAKEIGWGFQAAAVRKDHEDALAHIASERDAALLSLRNRPPRRADVSSPTPSTECAGVTGTQLAGPDAEFLTRYAAIAAGQSKALKACIEGWPR